MVDVQQHQKCSVMSGDKLAPNEISDELAKSGLLKPGYQKRVRLKVNPFTSSTTTV